jgi:pimeloyl-ACP methyl ester carboxylesterase
MPAILDGECLNLIHYSPKLDSMKTSIRRLITGIGLLLLMGATGLSALYFNQERLVFHPRPLSEDFRFSFQSAFIENNLPLNESQKINYLHFNPDSPLGTILYFHGNGGNLVNCGEVADSIAQTTGWSVLMMDYPGFGKSSPPLTKDEKILIEMGNRFVELIQSKRPNDPLVIYGRSLGTGIASLVAASHPKIPVILETGYVSLARIGHEMYPFLPESFARFDLDTARGLRSMPERKVLILHGTGDRTISVNHSRDLAKISPAHRYVEFEGGDHDNLDTFPKYWEELARFLDKDSR